MSPPVTPADLDFCRERLNCSVEEIRAMPPDDIARFMRAFHYIHLACHCYNDPGYGLMPDGSWRGCRCCGFVTVWRAS